MLQAINRWQNDPLVRPSQEALLSERAERFEGEQKVRLPRLKAGAAAKDRLLLFVPRNAAGQRWVDHVRREEVALGRRDVSLHGMSEEFDACLQRQLAREEKLVQL